MSGRQVFLDTETTGLRVEDGHRIIEIACVEMVGRRLTGARFHAFLNPERDIEEGAQKVHGIDLASLRDKPRFAAIADELIDFLEGAEVLAHNAAFDVGFVDAELERCAARVRRLRDIAVVTDTLALARRLFPGQPASLDRLCRRFGIDLSRRVHHGALLDAELLAELYLRMTQGQTSFELPSSESDPATAGPLGVGDASGVLRVLRANDEERERHRQRLAALEARAGSCLWALIERGTT
jgi:DNA polymerase-3 subunit epsilon